MAWWAIRACRCVSTIGLLDGPQPLKVLVEHQLGAALAAQRALPAAHQPCSKSPPLTAAPGDLGGLLGGSCIVTDLSPPSCQHMASTDAVTHTPLASMHCGLHRQGQAIAPEGAQVALLLGAHGHRLQRQHCIGKVRLQAADDGAWLGLGAASYPSRACAMPLSR